MSGPYWLVGFALLCPTLGCVPGSTPNTALVPGNPFGSTTTCKPATQPELSPEGKEQVNRVFKVSQEILAANPQIQIRPYFLVAGGAAEEIFHRGGQDVVITESLCRQCKTDGQLAAVLCHELGKQVAEREALKRFVPQVGKNLPMDVQVGNDHRGPNGPDDGTRLMELAKIEMDAKRARGAAVSPDTLARVFLQRSGYPPELLAEMASVLQAAHNNSKLETTLYHAPLATGQ